MKKVALILLLSSALFAQTYTKKDRINDMQIMAKAMSSIETGFFYNNSDLVNKGALTLSETIRKIEPPLEEVEEKNPMTRYMNEKVKFTNKLVKKIDEKTKIIIERFKDGDTAQAVQAYTKIMTKCMACHVHVRSW